MKRWHLVSIGSVLLILLALFLLQTRPGAGTIILTPGVPSKELALTGRVSATNTSILVNGTAKLAITTPRRVTRVAIEPQGTGGKLFANGSLVWDGAWNEYAPIGTLEGVRIFSRTTLALNNTSTLLSWLSENVPTGTTITDPAELLDMSAFALQPTPEQREQTIALSLRGDHDLLITTSGNLTVHLRKKDLNYYAGEDVLLVMLYDGEVLLENDTIPDDGANTTSAAGQVVDVTLAYENLPALVRMEIAAPGGDSLYNLTLDQGPWVLERSVFAIEPFALRLACDDPCMLDAITWHNTSLQNLSIDGQPWPLTQRGEHATRVLGAGVHTVRSPKGDVALSGFDRASISTPFVTTRYPRTQHGTVLILPEHFWVPVTQQGFTSTLALRSQGAVNLTQLAVVLS